MYMLNVYADVDATYMLHICWHLCSVYVECVWWCLHNVNIECICWYFCNICIDRVISMPTEFLLGNHSQKTHWIISWKFYLSLTLLYCSQHLSWCINYNIIFENKHGHNTVTWYSCWIIPKHHGKKCCVILVRPGWNYIVQI